jgi:translation initiation factor 5
VFVLDLSFSLLYLFSLFSDEGMDRFKIFLASHPGVSVKDQIEELKHIQTMASLRPADRCIIFLGAVFTTEVITTNEVEKHQEILNALAPSEIQQRHLIAAFEWLFGTKFPTLLKFFPKVLMQLYEAEIIEEDVFLAWAGDTTRNEYSAELSMMSFETLESLHIAAAPFIKWLQEADEEGDDEEEEEEEEGDEGGEEEDADDSEDA